MISSEEPFARVTASLVAEVGAAAAVLFARITWRSERDGCWRATRATLCEETGLTPGVLRTAMNVLRDRGWVAAERTSPDDATMIWKPVGPGHTDSANLAPPPARSTPTPLQDPHDPPARSAFSSLETVETKDSPSPAGEDDLFGDSPPEPLRAVPVEALFEEWYSGYPRKVGKGQARKAYAAALRKPGVTAQVLLDGLAAALPDLTSREVSYRPHPASWLNGERWADERAPVAPPSPAGAVYGETSPEAQAAFLATLPPPPKRDIFG